MRWRRRSSAEREAWANEFALRPAAAISASNSLAMVKACSSVPAACLATRRNLDLALLAPKSRWTFVQSEDRDVILKDDQMFESKLIPGFAIRLGELFDSV